MTCRLADSYLEVRGPGEGVALLNNFFAPFFEATFSGEVDRRYEISFEKDGVLFCGRGRKLFQSETPGDFVLDFEKFLINTFTREIPGDSLVLHAGGVLVDADIFLFCGPGGAGKTTAVLKSFSDSTKFISDEMVGLDPAGTCYPFPRPLAPEGELAVQTVFFEKQKVVTGKGNFYYGLPGADFTVGAPFQYDKCCLCLLSEREGGISPVSTGRGLTELAPLLISPEPASKRFRGLSSLARDHVNFFRLPRNQINRHGPEIFERINNVVSKSS